MGFSLGDMFLSALLFTNAAAILHEKRFLNQCEWRCGAPDQPCSLSWRGSVLAAQALILRAQPTMPRRCLPAPAPRTRPSPPSFSWTPPLVAFASPDRPPCTCRRWAGYGRAPSRFHQGQGRQRPLCCAHAAEKCVAPLCAPTLLWWRGISHITAMPSRPDRSSADRAQ
eukprot:COSAG02_NODE_3466_length_6694_cov_4.717665_3_plen_169_part_00